MFLKCILFAIFCIHFNVFRGEADKHTTYTEPIARQYLFMGDLVEILIYYLEVVEEPKMKFPTMMMSVTIDKTLGYNIEPFFPYFNDKKPVLDLNYASTNQNLVLDPSIVAFEINFVNKTLTEIAPSTVHLYPNRSSIVRNHKYFSTYDKNGENHTKRTINISSSNVGSRVFYSFGFVLSVDSPELVGLYKLSLHSSKEISTAFKVSISWNNKIKILLIARVAIYFCMTCLVFVFCLRQNRRINHLYPGVNCLFTYTSIYCMYPISKMWYAEILRQYEEIAYQVEVDLKYIILGLKTAILLLVVVSGVFIYYFRRRWVKVKVFHIFVWVILAHDVIQNYKASNMLHSYIAITSSFLLVTFTQMFMVYDEVVEKMAQSLKRPKRTRSRCKLIQNCSHIIYSVVVSFNLILASMISFGLPIHFRFIQFAIEEILCLLYWLYVCLPICKNYVQNSMILWQRKLTITYIIKDEKLKN